MADARARARARARAKAQAQAQQNNKLENKPVPAGFVEATGEMMMGLPEAAGRVGSGLAFAAQNPGQVGKALTEGVVGASQEYLGGGVGEVNTQDGEFMYQAPDLREQGKEFVEDTTYPMRNFPDNLLQSMAHEPERVLLPFMSPLGGQAVSSASALAGRTAGKVGTKLKGKALSMMTGDSAKKSIAIASSEVMDQRLPLSQRGATRLGKEMEVIGGKISEMIDDATASGKGVHPLDITAHLKKGREMWDVPGKKWVGAFDNVEKLWKEWVADKYGKRVKGPDGKEQLMLPNSIPVAAVQEWKTIMNRQLARDFGRMKYQGGFKPIEEATLAADRAKTMGYKKAIEAQIPEIAALNKTYGSKAGLKQAMEEWIIKRGGAQPFTSRLAIPMAVDTGAGKPIWRGGGVATKIGLLSAAQKPIMSGAGQAIYDISRPGRSNAVNQGLRAGTTGTVGLSGGAFHDEK